GGVRYATRSKGRDFKGRICRTPWSVAGLCRPSDQARGNQGDPVWPAHLDSPDRAFPTSPAGEVRLYESQSGPWASVVARAAGSLRSWAGRRRKRMTASAAARDYLRRGWAVIPVPFRRKKPVLKNWPNLRLSELEIPRHFSDRCNVGVLLGEASG